MIQAMQVELELQKDYFHQDLIESIYFGGGTPSVLELDEIQQLLNQINTHFSVSENAEITFELNPDDITETYLIQLKKTAVNRLSIGCQSFSDVDLKFLHRRHTATQAYKTIKWAQNQGFTNISIDLIYGLQGQSMKSWEETLVKALNLSVQHISAYHLTIEAGTQFDEWIKSGKIKKVEEEQSIKQFEVLMEKTAINNYVHYEISNFALPGFLSIHNNNYWKQKPYLGIGPSAHSYNGRSRQWNINDNEIYISNIKKGIQHFESEQLNIQTRYNEYILTALRTMWGIDLEFLESAFSKELSDYCLNLAHKFQDYGLLKQENKHLKLTDQGKLVSDNIISDLLFVANP